MKTKTAASWFAVLMIASASFADEMEPSEIFKQTVAAYEAMDTYSAEGTIVSDLIRGNVNVKMETPFSLKLKKPNQYLISWTQKNSMTPAFAHAGATWNDGTQPFLYMGVMKAYSKMSSDEMALGGATGISGGAAFTIPSLFLKVFKEQPVPFVRLIDPKLGDNEPVEEDDCYVISGSSLISKNETFWISTTSHLIRKYSRSFEPPAGGIQTPKMTEEQLEAAVKSLDGEVTEERKEALRKMMKQAENAMKTAKLKGTSTEIHTKISSPEMSAEDFIFKIPAGTVLKDSILGAALPGR